MDIVYTGLRPGEKLYEEPLHVSEELQPTEINGILLAAPRICDHAMIVRLLDEMVSAATQKNSDHALAVVRRLVPEYQPTDNTGGGTVSELIVMQEKKRPLATVTDIRQALREGAAT